MFAPGPPKFAGRAISRRPPQIPEQGAGINQLFLILLVSLLILSCCFVALCRFVLLYADGALRQGTHVISLSFKVFFVIYLYITLFCSLCCPPSVSSLLCPARSPPVSSSLYTALCRFTQILMIPSDSFFLFF